VYSRDEGARGGERKRKGVGGSEQKRGREKSEGERERSE
jgi:hypothetical protein